VGGGGGGGGVVGGGGGGVWGFGEVGVGGKEGCSLSLSSASRRQKKT